MQDIYTQLFNSYAHDVQRHLKMAEDETVERLVQLIPMSGEDKVNLADQLTGLRTLCCAESLALGIWIGLRLSQEIIAF